MGTIIIVLKISYHWGYFWVSIKKIDLQSIMLGEISQSEKDKYHMISLLCGTY